MRPEDTCSHCPRPKIRILPPTGRVPLVVLCAFCDMGGGMAHSGPPVMIEYIRKGHQ